MVLSLKFDLLTYDRKRMTPHNSRLWGFLAHGSSVVGSFGLTPEGALALTRAWACALALAEALAGVISLPYPRRGVGVGVGVGFIVLRYLLSDSNRDRAPLPRSIPLQYPSLWPGTRIDSVPVSISLAQARIPGRGTSPHDVA